MKSKTAARAAPRGGEPVAVDQLPLDGGEQALRRGVVVGRAHLTHGPGDARLGQAPGERQGHVLGALVGVVDQSGIGAAPAHRHVEGVDDQLGPQVGAMDHPTIRLVQQSRMVARYSHPFHVGR
jgi:hypothetical protein